eukprot:gene35331-43564_t
MDGSDRVTALGRLTMSYTIGSVIGPTIGGFLGASGDYYFGAKLAVAGSLLSVVITLFMPDHVAEKVKTEEDIVKESNESKIASTTAIPTIMTVVSIVWLFLSTKIITSVANAMGAAAFPLILKNIYSLNESSLGLTMSLMSAFNAVVNGFLLGPILTLAGGNTNFVIAIMIQYVLSTTITSESTTRVGQNAKGTLLGLEHSLFAAARVFAPQAGVYLLQEGGVSAVSGACAAVFFGVYVAWNCLSDDQVGGSVAVKEGKE